MNNQIKNFMKEQSTATNGDLLTLAAYTAALAGIGLVLNHQLFKSRIKNIQLEQELSVYKVYDAINNERVKDLEKKINRNKE